MTIRNVAFISIITLFLSGVFLILSITNSDKPPFTIPAYSCFFWIALLGVTTTNALKKMSTRITALEEKLQEKD